MGFRPFLCERMKEFDYNIVKDPAVFKVNALPAHSDHTAFASAEEMREGSSSLRASLNGLWKFHYARNYSSVIPDFQKADADVSGWEDIHVPSNMQMEGYDVPAYVNTQYPWDGSEDITPGQIPEIFNPVGQYVVFFELPACWKGMGVRISFQGVESGFSVWLNGSWVGYSEDSFTPTDFDLTPFLKEGRNRLAVLDFKWTSGSWLEDQDMYRFSGIFRDVFLYAVPAVHLEDLRILSGLDDSFRTGQLEAALSLSGCFDGAELSWKLTERGSARPDAGGRPSFPLDREIRSGKCAAEEKILISCSVEDVKAWSAEDPNLYQLELVLKGKDGGILEEICENIGFRRFEIRDGLMCLNGKRIVFHGTDRHEFSCDTGRTPGAEEVSLDLRIMKRNNINAIRTSHYPNTSALYRLADELGLYVIDENNMETHGMWDMYWQKRETEMFPGNRKEWEPILLDRVRSMIGRDRNHPCILMWSCGNESLTGTVILAMSREMKKLDPTRLVHYEGDMHAEESLRIREITDVESEMYTPAAKIREYLKNHREKPFILCEYVHSMGNSNGAMHKYTDMAYEEELYQGGFIWDFIDQGLTARDRFGNDTILYGGDWDDRPTDGIFCGNGIVFADGTPTPKLQEVKYNYRDIAVKAEKEKITVINRHMFRSTADYRCVVTLEKDGAEIRRAELETDVPPLSAAEYALPFGVPETPGEYALNVSFRLKEDCAWAEAGFETAWGQGVWKTGGGKRDCAGHPALRVVENGWNVTMAGEHFRVMFSRAAGALVSYRWGGKEMLKAPLMPNFWRAPINNDYGNGMPQRYAQWKIASMYVSAGIREETRKKNTAAVPVIKEDGSAEFTVWYDLPTSPSAGCRVTYTVHPCGKVDVLMHYDPAAGLGDMPEFGMVTKLDADCNRVKFYGLGPDENYIDRREGARLGIWEYRAEENYTPYLLPQECGNRTGVRWAEVTDGRGAGLKVWLNGGEFSALPWTPHEIENAAHGYELVKSCYTVLKMSAMQMGVGGDDSWGARTHEEYLIDVSKPVEFAFSFRGM